MQLRKNNHLNIIYMYLHVSCLQAVLVDSLTIDTQSADQSVAQQLTTTTQSCFPLVADCTMSPSCCEIFGDIMVLIWNFF